MVMKMILEEELRPAIEVGGDFNLRILVHTTNQNKHGEYLTEMKDGNLSYVNPESIIFIDGEHKFNEFAWDTSGSYASYSKRINSKPTFETVSEINDWLDNNKH